MEVPFGSILVYAGGSYEVPKSTSDTGGSLAPKEDNSRLCFTKYKTVAGDYNEGLYCGTGTPSDPDGGCYSAGGNPTGCTEISYSEVGPSNVSEGRCVDP